MNTAEGFLVAVCAPVVIGVVANAWYGRPQLQRTSTEQARALFEERIRLEARIDTEAQARRAKMKPPLLAELLLGLERGDRGRVELWTNHKPETGQPITSNQFLAINTTGTPYWVMPNATYMHNDWTSVLTTTTSAT